MPLPQLEEFRRKKAEKAAAAAAAVRGPVTAPAPAAAFVAPTDVREALQPLSAENKNLNEQWDPAIGAAPAAPIPQTPSAPLSLNTPRVVPSPEDVREILLPMILRLNVTLLKLSCG